MEHSSEQESLPFFYAAPCRQLLENNYSNNKINLNFAAGKRDYFCCHYWKYQNNNKQKHFTQQQIKELLLKAAYCQCCYHNCIYLKKKDLKNISLHLNNL